MPRIAQSLALGVKNYSSASQGCIQCIPDHLNIRSSGTCETPESRSLSCPFEGLSQSVGHLHSSAKTRTLWPGPLGKAMFDAAEVFGLEGHRARLEAKSIKSFIVSIRQPCLLAWNRSDTFSKTRLTRASSPSRLELTVKI